MKHGMLYLYLKMMSHTFSITPSKFLEDLMIARPVWMSDCASDGQNKFARHMYHNHYVFPYICLLTHPLVAQVQPE
jgi:hypothetical protein